MRFPEPTYRPQQIAFLVGCTAQTVRRVSKAIGINEKRDLNGWRVYSRDEAKAIIREIERRRR